LGRVGYPVYADAESVTGVDEGVDVAKGVEHPYFVCGGRGGAHGDGPILAKASGGVEESLFQSA
jgi:hypothetical protein